MVNEVGVPGLATIGAGWLVPDWERGAPIFDAGTTMPLLLDVCRGRDTDEANEMELEVEDNE